MTLSPRQREIMLLICDGQRDKEIASKLGISIHVVREHIEAIIRNLKASNIKNAISIFERRLREKSLTA